MQDCYEHLDEMVQNNDEVDSRKELIELCRTIAVENPEE